MKTASLLAPCFLGALTTPAVWARGVSPYLPLNMEPEVERQIERVLVLGDKPVMTRPIAAASVLEALPKACKIDEVLCENVRRYLGKYTRDSGLTHLSAEGAATSSASRVVPNRYGLDSSSAWNASLQAYIQPSDYLLVNLGGTAYDGDANPAGSVVSLGFSWAQLDIGYRGHWLSPLSDSSMLISTEAQTMPSVTLSNYTPLTRFGLTYEAFVARMSTSDRIAFQGRFTSGEPRIAGLHVAAEPVSGWSLGINRLMQYGGGERGGSSLGDLFDAFFQPSKFDNAGGGGLAVDDQLGNQVGSITSRFLYPGNIPFSVYFEYGGEDTSRGKNYLLGNSSLSAGVHFPRLWKRFDLTYEVSEWQNGWYDHHIYQDGLVNEGLVIGHWGGDQRVFTNSVGAQSHMIRAGWEPQWGGVLELKYRTIRNERYTSASFPYERAYDVTARYSYPVRDFTIGGEVFAGNDVFGESFSRIAAFVRYTPDAGGVFALLHEDGPAGIDAEGLEVFIDAGANANQVQIDLSDELPRTKSEREIAAHFAIGARRAVTEHSDLGVRVEYDDINGHALIGARALDYRYRFRGHLALGAFLGAARYDVETPAYGIYGGAGVQWRNLLPGWDIGADFRYATKVARDHLVSSDPGGARPDSFYDITSTTLYVTKRF
jgi:Capsule assembly protein Wzi